MVLKPSFCDSPSAGCPLHARKIPVSPEPSNSLQNLFQCDELAARGPVLTYGAATLSIGGGRDISFPFNSKGTVDVLLIALGERALDIKRVLIGPVPFVACSVLERHSTVA
jgi:hypothetical protein